MGESGKEPAFDVYIIFYNKFIEQGGKRAENGSDFIFIPRIVISTHKTTIKIEKF